MGIPTKKRRKYDEKYSIFAKYSAPAALTYYFITNAFQPEMFRIRCIMCRSTQAYTPEACRSNSSWISEIVKCVFFCDQISTFCEALCFGNLQHNWLWNDFVTFSAGQQRPRSWAALPRFLDPCRQTIKTIPSLNIFLIEENHFSIFLKNFLNFKKVFWENPLAKFVLMDSKTRPFPSLEWGLSLGPVSYPLSCMD